MSNIQIPISLKKVVYASLLVICLLITSYCMTGSYAEATVANTNSINIPVTKTVADPLFPVYRDNRIAITTLPIYKEERAKYVSTTLVVAPKGNDTTGTGTNSKPFATVAKALSVAKKGDTVYVQPGTYTIGTTLTIPSHVHLQGSGIGRTIFKPSATFKPNYFQSFFFASTLVYTKPNNQGLDFLGEIKKEGFQVIQGFTLDCAQKVKLGIHSWGRQYIAVNRIHFKDCESRGVAMSGTQIEIANAAFTENPARTDELKKRSASAIGLNGLKGAYIHHNTITEDTGGGIGKTNSFTRKLRIYNNKIIINSSGLNKVNHDPAIEVWDIQDDGRIYNNELKGWTSLVQMWPNASEGPLKEWGNLYIYGNKLGLLELASHGAEVYGNHFENFTNQAIWIEGFESDNKQNYFRTGNIKIYRNLGTRSNALKNQGNGWFIQLGPNGASVNGFYVFNNTVHNVKRFASLGAWKKGNLYSHIVFANNLMSSSGGIGFGGNQDAYQNIFIRKNAFDTETVNRNFSQPSSAVIGHAIIENKDAILYFQQSALNYTGNLYTTFLKPKRSSEIVDQGVFITGLTYKGKAPDIGRYEY